MFEPQSILLSESIAGDKRGADSNVYLNEKMLFHLCRNQQWNDVMCVPAHPTRGPNKPVVGGHASLRDDPHGTYV